MSLSEKTLKKNESRSVNGHYFFYRTKKFGLKKKLEQSEQKSIVFIMNHSDLLFESSWSGVNLLANGTTFGLKRTGGTIFKCCILLGEVVF